MKMINFHQWLESTVSEMSADQVAQLLASQHFNKKANLTAEYLKDKWISSDKFVFMQVPINSVTPATEVEPDAKTTSSGPIIVDKNKTGYGRYKGNFGPAADIIILDGKHRHAQAKAEGNKTIDAMVGIQAVPI